MEPLAQEVTERQHAELHLRGEEVALHQHLHPRLEQGVVDGQLGGEVVGRELLALARGDGEESRVEHQHVALGRARAEVLLERSLHHDGEHRLLGGEVVAHRLFGLDGARSGVEAVDHGFDRATAEATFVLQPGGERPRLGRDVTGIGIGWVDHDESGPHRRVGDSKGSRLPSARATVPVEPWPHADATSDVVSTAADAARDQTFPPRTIMFVRSTIGPIRLRNSAKDGPFSPGVPRPGRRTSSRLVGSLTRLVDVDADASFAGTWG